MSIFVITCDEKISILYDDYCYGYYNRLDSALEKIQELQNDDNFDEEDILLIKIDVITNEQCIYDKDDIYQLRDESNCEISSITYEYKKSLYAWFDYDIGEIVSSSKPNEIHEDEDYVCEIIFKENSTSVKKYKWNKYN